MKKTVLITGDSTGFGCLTAMEFHSEEWNTIATMSSPQNETRLGLLDNTKNNSK